jgi:hypothetical protein
MSRDVFVARPTGVERADAITIGVPVEGVESRLEAEVRDPRDALID